MQRHRHLLLAAVLGLLFGIALAPRAAKVDLPAEVVPEAAAASPQRFPVPTPVPTVGPTSVRLPGVGAVMDTEAAASTTPPQLARLSGWVVDGRGDPIQGAVVHVHSPSGVQAVRADEQGRFRLAVPPGSWQLEAGLYDGGQEWRSAPAPVTVAAGDAAEVGLEILLQGAGHTVRVGLKELMGVGWEVGDDDGPLLAGDVLVEVGDRLLTDLQPEAVHAALRERPGEQVPALVLRPSPNGGYAEVPVLLTAR